VCGVQSDVWVESDVCESDVCECDVCESDVCERSLMCGWSLMCDMTHSYKESPHISLTLMCV